MKTVAVDIGNSNIVAALFTDDEVACSFRIFTDLKRTGDEYYVTLKTLFDENGVKEVDGAIISSVVPNLTLAFEKIIFRLFSVKSLIVSSAVETGLVKSSIPPELGSDLLSNLSYAHKKKKNENVMVVDFGTALTLSVVKSDGSVQGCAIAPGLLTAVNSLFGSTAQLPQVELKIPDCVLGRTTTDSIRSGIMRGYAGMVSSMIEKAEKEIGQRLSVIATGGLSKTISPLIERIDEVDKLLTLKGINYIYSLNVK